MFSYQKFLQLLLFIAGLLMLTAAPGYAQGFEGYYRFPTLHGETIIFTAEGDLWAVPVTGGLARRLTSHPGEETNPHVSPDGTTIAFSAAYEGPAEVYTMPIDGGLPTRWTYEGETSVASGWTPAGELLYTTTHFSTLPDQQLVKINLASQERTRIPLSQASEPSFDGSGKTLFFVRPADHRNVTKRYTGGTARQIWKFADGAAEATKLTGSDHRGESHHPLWWNGRVYFITDRDGTMNLWSMTEAGQDLRQHTRHEGFDVRYAALHQGRIVYRVGADIWLYDISSGADRKVPIRLTSDLDQLREKWVDNPSEYITNVDLHPKGEQVVITTRGRVFVMPVGSGRRVQLSRKEGVRYRDAAFSADGKDILVLSDESGEFEFVSIAANGIGDHRNLTSNGKTLRFAAVPSPDGKWAAYRDLDQHLWLLNLSTGAQQKISTTNNGIGDIAWSPDSRWISFVQTAGNTFDQIMLYRLADGSLTPLTTDRANSGDPAWSPDGQWIYFLSDRHFETLVGSPWGPRQPEPYFDRPMNCLRPPKTITAMAKRTKRPP